MHSSLDGGVAAAALLAAAYAVSGPRALGGAWVVGSVHRSEQRVGVFCHTVWEQQRPQAGHHHLDLALAGNSNAMRRQGERAPTHHLSTARPHGHVTTADNNRQRSIDAPSCQTTRATDTYPERLRAARFALCRAFHSSKRQRRGLAGAAVAASTPAALSLPWLAGTSPWASVRSCGGAVVTTAPALCTVKEVALDNAAAACGHPTVFAIGAVPHGAAWSWLVVCCAAAAVGNTLPAVGPLT